MVREYSILNEKGQEFSFMDIKNYCLMTEPQGLGYQYSNTYEQISNVFIPNSRKLSQSQISGTVNFMNYDNYKKLVDFIEQATSLKFKYKVPFSTGAKIYYRTINMASLTKTEIQTDRFIKETITFDCKGLWYEENSITYTLSYSDTETRWDFYFSSNFSIYNNRNIIFNNSGHTEAPIYIEFKGPLVNPCITVAYNSEELYSLNIPIEIEEYERILYNTNPDDLYLRKMNVDGTTESLFNESYIEPLNRNIIRLPKGSSTISITSESEVILGTVCIYPQYKVV